MSFASADIAACYGADLPSRTISWATSTLFVRPRLGPSHVAILCRNRAIGENDPDWYWVESTTMCGRPCLMAENVVSGVQFHRPMDRIDDYLRGRGRVDLYRMHPFHSLGAYEENVLWDSLMCRQGATYDWGGAVLSGSRVYHALRSVWPAEVESLFCSELLAAILMRLNRLNHANPALYHPGRLIRELVRTGKYHLHMRFR